MELKADAKLLRIFLGEADKVKHSALYEAIVREARRLELAGATVWRGIMGFGPTSRIRTTSVLVSGSITSRRCSSTASSKPVLMRPSPKGIQTLVPKL